MTEALTSVTGRTITRPITSVAGSRIDDVYGEDGEDGDEDADESTTMSSRPFYSLVFRPLHTPVEKKGTPQLRPTHPRRTEVWLIAAGGGGTGVVWLIADQELDL